MIRLAGIEKESYVDGEGLRYVLFLQGCNHNCKECHNPETHDFNGGNEVDEQEIISDILSSPLLDGITFSGGDPLFQAGKLIRIAQACIDNNLDIWLYTGFVFDEFIKFINNEKHDTRINQDMINLLQMVDVVVDGPFVTHLRTLEDGFKGSKNQRIIDCKKSLRLKKIVEHTVEY